MQEHVEEQEIYQLGLDHAEAQILLDFHKKKHEIGNQQAEIILATKREKLQQLASAKSNNNQRVLLSPGSLAASAPLQAPWVAPTTVQPQRRDYRMRFLRMSRIKRWMTMIKVSCQVRTRRPRHVPSFRFWMPDLKVMKIKGTCPRKDLNPSSHPRSYRLSNSARSQPRPGVLRNHLAPH